jgi:putative ABC transport system permease protein
VQFLIETIRLALSNLRLRLLRSVLTALGIIFGVAAVIIMSSLGEGKKQQALAQIDRLGARNIIVRSIRPPETQNQNTQRASFVNRYGLTREDLAVIRQNFPDAEAIVPLKDVGSQIVRNERRSTSQAYGTTPALLNVARLTVARGRYLNQGDLEATSLVAVIGDQVAREFFPLEDPVGQTLRIDAKAFVVVGVLQPVGLAGGAGATLIGRDLNSDVHIPITTAEATFGDTVFRRVNGAFQGNAVQVAEIYLSVPTRDRVMADSSRLERIIQVRKPNQPDVRIIVPFELLATAEREARTFNLVFGAIAAISLLVGGIGIMNIMLASVTERTREIGIRRAIGATRRHILWQFLVETSVLSAVGGMIGVGLGVGGSLLLTYVVKALPQLPVIGRQFESGVELPTALTGWSIIVAFVVATATGLIFGLYPARRAAQQDPIVALRHD